MPAAILGPARRAALAPATRFPDLCRLIPTASHALLQASVPQIVTSDSTFSGDPFSVIDGNDSTGHQGVNPMTNRWVRIDFGQPVIVAAWRIKQGGTFGNQAQYVNPALQSSDDNSNWVTRDTQAASFGIDSGVRSVPPVRARWWRYLIIGAGANVGSDLQTFSLYGPETVRPRLQPFRGMPNAGPVVGGLLTAVNHGPAGADAQVGTSVSGWTPVAVDRANLSLKVLVPASGRIQFTLISGAQLVSGFTPYWVVLEDDNVIAVTSSIFGGGGNQTGRITKSVTVSGLRPGFHTYSWGHYTDGGGTMKLMVGPSYGSPVFEARAA